MRTLIAATMMLTLLMGLTVLASAASNIDPAWGHWDTNGYFVLDRMNVEWASVWGSNVPYPTSGMNNRIATQILGDSRWSGGEWFDAEGLYMDIVEKTPGHVYLEWLLINSYPGVEPGEWTPAVGWTGTGSSTYSTSDPTSVVGGTGEAGWFSAGSGSYAYHRDHAVPYNPPPNAWAYRSNPVIALNLGGVTTGYEYALVLDSLEANNSATQRRGTPYDITTSAALYMVTDGTAWRDWVPPDGEEFPAGVIADVDLSGSGVSFVASGSSAKNFALDHIETTGTMTANGATWPMPYNWYWTGSLELPSDFTLPTGKTSVHYAMWCSNDLINLTGTGYNLDTTPELPSGALLLLGMVPAGLAWWRRKGR